MRIVVTGGAGFIGSHVTEGALALGHDVLVLDDLSTGARTRVPAGASFVQLDLRDGAEVARVLTDFRPTVVSHQAAQTSARDPRYDADVNVLGSLALLEACVSSRVRSVVFASTAAAGYGDLADRARTTERERPLSPLDCGKLAVERYLAYYAQTHQLRSVVLRYANVYGPRQEPNRQPGVVATFIDRMLRDQPIQINALSQRGDDGCVRDYVFVRDVVRANLAAMERSLEHRVMNVCSGDGTTTRALAERIRGLCGSRSSICHASRRPDDLRRCVFDPARLRALWRPTSLSAGLAITVPWFQAQMRGSLGEWQAPALSA
jgi:UDP-glucose 4-epimerase